MRETAKAKSNAKKIGTLTIEITAWATVNGPIRENINKGSKYFC
jgi:hypothetical protein